MVLVAKRNVVKLVILFLFVPNVVLACSVPVFRYALERWTTDRYDVTIFHRGPLGSNDEEIVKFLKNSAVKCNLEFTTVDLAAVVDESMQKLWQAQSTETLPWVVLRYPRIWRRNITFFSPHIRH